MKSLICPHCNQEEVPLWQLIVFPSPFWIKRMCSHCHSILLFNLTTLGWIGVSIVAWVTLGEFVIKPFYNWIGIESYVYVDIILTFLIVSWPIWWARMKIFSSQ